MLERPLGLSADQLDAVARLAAATIDHDGGRLKLEWGALASRPAGETRDALWWEDGALVGFAGLYAFGSSTPEVTGMVHPGHRRRGIGARLLDEIARLVAARGAARFLLVTPRDSVGARRLAIARAGTLDHSEHALALHGSVADGPTDPAISLRPATTSDAPDIGRLLADAFGHSFGPLDFASKEEPTLVGERDGTVIATLRVHRSKEGWGVYGFAVDPPCQGRGIGRDLLRRVCRQAGEAGVERVHLEVSVDNDRALNLYRSLGFAHEATEDYYDIAVKRPATSRR